MERQVSGMREIREKRGVRDGYLLVLQLMRSDENGA
jgi:hypothetical protein